MEILITIGIEDIFFREQGTRKSEMHSRQNSILAQVPQMHLSEF